MALDVSTIKRDRETPYYYYDLSLLKETLKSMHEASPEENYLVHYAIKANSNPILLRVIAESGLGADCVSGGEIKIAIEAGFSPDKITYAGVGKTDKEIEYALECGISCFNVESIQELDAINEIASKKGVVANVALRVNPNIDAHTHHYITTGLEENKFGIDLRILDNAIEYILSNNSLKLVGLHFHIGSQITITEPFKLLSKKINSLIEKYESRGVSFLNINVGGGLGIDYDNPDANPIPDFVSYFEAFRSTLELPKGTHLHFELGRAIVGQCGSLISKVIYVKEGIGKKFLIVDAGMTDLIRPALYGAHHIIQNLTATDSSVTDKYDVVGPICESSDCFGKDEILPICHRGDIIAFRSAGAYGEVMASMYNARHLPQSVVE
jgi:diaminopimelate decarboxylase